MAVSSLSSTLFKCCTTLASPFIGRLREKLRFDPKVSARQENAPASGRHAQRLVCMQIAQQLARAVAAAAATRTDTELEGKLLERARAVARTFTNCLFGDGVADADVQALGSSLRSIIT